MLLSRRASSTSSSTESESDQEPFSSHTTEQLPCFLLEDPPRPPGALAQDLHAAFDKLQDLDHNAILMNSELHEDISEASACMQRFARFFLSKPQSVSDSIMRITLARFFDATTLQLLFRYRATFYTIAATDTPLGVTITCWVDHVLAYLGLVIYTIASGSTASFHSKNTGMQKQQMSAAVRAATQLPQLWETVADVVSVKEVSPAARRLASNLLFGAYIMAPELGNYDSKIFMLSDLQHSTHCLECLLDQASEYLNEEWDNKSDVSVLQGASALSIAMMLNLHVTIDTLTRSSVDGAVPLLSFHPQTTANIMRFLQYIMRVDPNNKLEMPLLELGDCLSILLRWGQFIPWCWKMWDDDRAINIETITQLTWIWLHHVSSQWDQTEWRNCLAHNIRKGYLPAWKALLRIIDGVLPSTELDQTSLPMLYRCIWGIVHIRRVYDTSLSAITCRCLCDLFFGLGYSEADNSVKDLIVEAILLCSSSMIIDALHLAPQSWKDNFQKNIGNVYHLHTSRLSTPDVQINDIISMKHTLRISAILCSGIQDRFPFLGSLGDIFPCLSSKLFSPKRAYILDALEAFVVAVASLGSSLFHVDYQGLRKIIKTTSFWHTFHLRCCRTPIFYGSIAELLCIMPSDTFPDSISYLETWEYFIEGLLMLLDRQFIGDDETLALLASTAICSAALTLVASKTPQNLMPLLLDSPWTAQLNSRLDRLLNGKIEDYIPDTNKELVSYFQVLQKELEIPGRELLQHLNSSALPSESSTLSKKKSTMDMPSRRLWFLRTDDDSSHLLFVTKTFARSFA